MDTSKLVAAVALGGLSIGGLTAAGVSAQGYGSNPDPAPAVGEDFAVEDFNQSEAVAQANEGVGDNANVRGPRRGQIIQTQADDETVIEGERNGEDDGRRGGRRGHRGGCNLEVAAEAIGIDEADLRVQLDQGSTIASVAADNGVDVDSVVDAMVEAKQDRIAEKVEAGRITAEEAEEKLAEAEDRISDRVNGLDDEDGTEA